MTQLIIRKCKKEEWKTLIDLGIKTFAQTYQAKNTKENFEKYITSAFSTEQIQRELANSKCHFYFAFFNEELAGYIKLNEPGAQTDLNHANSMELERIYVEASFKGQGIGKALIKKSEEKARERNLPKIWLGVWTKNPEAIAFYNKMGFQEVGTHVFTVGDDDQLDLILEKEV